jgi:hypothetical protein
MQILMNCHDEIYDSFEIFFQFQFIYWQNMLHVITNDWLLKNRVKI